MLIYPLVTILESSGLFVEEKIPQMQQWTAQLAKFYLSSKQGVEEGSSVNFHGLYFDLTVASLSLFSKLDGMFDATRARLTYRLTRAFPAGHFALNGSQPYEAPTHAAFHLMTLNLVGWMRAALMVDAARAHCELPGTISSLWWARHQSENKSSQPVLLKVGRQGSKQAEDLCWMEEKMFCLIKFINLLIYLFYLLLYSNSISPLFLLPSLPCYIKNYSKHRLFVF